MEISLKDRLQAEVVEEFSPLVEYIARRMASKLGGSVSVDDLTQWGILGLLQAFKAFDPCLGVKFQSYAEHRIRGYMLDELRKLNPNSRSTYELEKLIQAARADLMLHKVRSPTYNQLAKKLNVSVERIEKHQLEFRAEGPISLDAPEMFSAEDRKALLNSEQNHSDDIVSKIAAMQKLELIVAGHHPINRACFMLFYIWGLDQVEIAELFACSASRISQRIKKVQFNDRT